LEKEDGVREELVGGMGERKKEEEDGGSGGGGGDGGRMKEEKGDGRKKEKRLAFRRRGRPTYLVVVIREWISHWSSAVVRELPAPPSFLPSSPRLCLFGVELGAVAWLPPLSADGRHASLFSARFLVAIFFPPLFLYAMPFVFRKIVARPLQFAEMWKHTFLVSKCCKAFNGCTSLLQPYMS
jgi:hypothetical protein